MNVIPYKDAISKVNSLYDNGNKSIIYTTRSKGRENNDINKVIEVGYKFIFNQFKPWG